jgi:hypothetical protein
VEARAPLLITFLTSVIDLVKSVVPARAIVVKKTFHGLLMFAHVARYFRARHSSTLTLKRHAVGRQTRRDSGLPFPRSNQILLTFRLLFFMLYDCAIVVTKDDV